MHYSGFVGLFYTGAEWIMRFAIMNLLWVFINSPLILLALFIVLAPEGKTMIAYAIPLFILSPFLLFPSTSALFATVRDWITQDYIGYLGKEYFKYFRTNYKKSVMAGFILAFIWFVWVFDLFFLQAVHVFLGVLLLFFGTLLYAFTIVYFCLNAHYHLNIKSTLRNAFLLTLGKPFMLFLILIIHISIYYISFRFLFVFFLFSFSISSYLSFYVFYRFILKVESNITR
ncbi:YesL family protein [Evansella tamaricis]|uniref:DUF624 domain-containing protein n=1 Tax=Evansella tamaricis TaxID=2069301 RepID=A0ABS6JGT1_9BACI|nr:DUF624 domain-containing protein [Evansella tamaricis]MBU9712874.1 DUF624 domain-containing protein [Evansella tamaricis]